LGCDDFGHCDVAVQHLHVWGSLCLQRHPHDQGRGGESET
jgi:hypothetical protein